jgi:hypothetical protein
MPDPKIAELTRRIQQSRREAVDHSPPAWWPYPPPLPVRYVEWPCEVPALPDVPCLLAVRVRGPNIVPAVEAVKRVRAARLVVTDDDASASWRKDPAAWAALEGWGVSVLTESAVGERLAYSPTVWDDQVYVPSRETRSPPPNTWVPEHVAPFPDWPGVHVRVPGRNVYRLV